MVKRKAECSPDFVSDTEKSDPECKLPKDLSNPKPNGQHLTIQLASAEGLNDVIIETIFHLEEETTTLQQNWDHAQEEILSLKAQKDEALGKLKHLQDRMEDTMQHLGDKDKEIAHLNILIIDMSGLLHKADALVANQKTTILKVESLIAPNQQDVLDLKP